MKLRVVNKICEFNLSVEEVLLSKRIFNDKIVQFIITNGFHIIPEEGNYKILRFPENDLSLNEFYEFYDNLVKSTSAYKILILSNSLMLLTGMPKSLVRIATENGIEIPKFENDTFCGNIGELQIDTMNGRYVQSHGVRFVTNISERIQTKLNPEELKEVESDIQIIGEMLIRNQLTNLLKSHQ